MMSDAPPPDPLREKPTRSITAPAGFTAVGHTCGIKESGKPDLALIVSDRPAAAAGVFTTNAFKGAPVLVGMDHLAATGGRARAIVCNSGNSNVATLGMGGREDAEAMCRAAAEAVGCTPEAVLPASTGIIGRKLPIDAILGGIRDAAPGLGASARHDHAAATAILTTDLVTKSALHRATIGGAPISVGGIGKGSGMIAPSMATMLVFVTTDAAVEPSALRLALAEANRASFNRMSVDSDTSTSDTLYVLANGAAANDPITDADHAGYPALVDALTGVCRDLADAVVRDGEGATRTFAVGVRNAASVDDADRIGRAVVDSPLVKCAIHGCDPNWGRLVMAAGKSGARIDPDRFTVEIEGTCVFRDGSPADNSEAALAALAERMSGDRVHVTLDLHHRDGADADWLGCDLSRQYIAINADYTT